MDVSSATDQPETKSASTHESDGSDVSMGVQSHEEAEGSFTSRPETQRELNLAAEVCHYFREMFITTVLRFHGNIGVFDRSRLQLCHGSRTVILVSSAIDFSGGDGLDKFIATLLASCCFVFKKREDRKSVV